MNRFIMFGAGVVLLSGVLSVAGCGDKQEPKAQITVGSASPVAASVDALGPRYEATLAEGIDFKKQGYPSFLAEVSGMSDYETWGRWTDALTGPAAKFRFKQALPKKFTVEIVAHAFGPNIDAPIKVRVAGIEKTFTITSPEKQDNIYRLTFETDGVTDSLEIIPPKPTSPNETDPQSKDSRKLGIAISSIKIRD